MIPSHDWRPQYQELLNEVNELAEAISELAARLEEKDPSQAAEEDADRRDHLAWLQRQHAAALVWLHEAERARLVDDAADQSEDPA